ncbi:MAG: hypothetical protein HY814_11075 [Candidatus Riflebacteria bacterium]|nr:hypothetical protein [Candidatus Riflebacteria bacterium]
MTADLLDKELHALARFHPTASMVRAEDGQPRIRMLVPSKEHAGVAYEVVGVYPPDYPASAVRFYVVNYDIPEGCPHLYSDGSLCLDHTSAFSPRSTAATALAWVVVWLYCLDKWLSSGCRVNIWDTYLKA